MNIGKKLNLDQRLRNDSHKTRIDQIGGAESVNKDIATILEERKSSVPKLNQSKDGPAK